jgi:hypothetical protein
LNKDSPKLPSRSTRKFAVLLSPSCREARSAPDIILLSILDTVLVTNNEVLFAELLDPLAALLPMLLDLKVLITVIVHEVIDFVSPLTIIRIPVPDFVAPLGCKLYDLLLTTHHFIEVLELLSAVLLPLVLLLLTIFVLIIPLGNCDLA